MRFFKIKGKTVYIGFLVVITLSFYSFSSFHSVFIASVRGSFQSFSATLFFFLNRPLNLIETYCRTNAELLAENEILRQKNDALQEYHITAIKNERENKYLREFLNFLPEPPASFKTTRVLAVPHDYLYTSMIISVPSSEMGIHIDQPVLWKRWIVGRVIEMGTSTARVMLLTNELSRVPVRIESTGEQAILAGTGKYNELILSHVDRQTGEQLEKKAQPGDLLLTSGFGGIFPAQFPVAIISRIEGDKIFARLPYDSKGLEYVMLLNN